MPGLLLDAFKTHDLETWPGPDDDNIPEELHGTVKVVGYEKKSPLATSHLGKDLFRFLEDHLGDPTTDGSPHTTPPFYYPSDKPSGPDLVFVVEINSQKYPVFVQVKYRTDMNETKTVAAVKTTDLESVIIKAKAESEEIKAIEESYMEEADKEAAINNTKQEIERKLRDWCGSRKNISRDRHSSRKYISMMIVYPLEFDNSKIEDVTIEPNRVLIKVAKTNFARIFSQEHAVFLKNLKDSLRYKP